MTKPLFVLAALAAVLVSAGSGQTMPGPPKELSALDWMVGDFDADMTMYQPGMAEGMPMKGAMSTKKSLGGVWLESRITSDMDGVPFEGLQMTSYDSSKKKYIAFWFDNGGPGAAEFTGTLKNGVFVMESKPTEFPGMPGKHAFRATAGLKGPGKYLYRVEMNSGEGWFKMVEGMMTRKP